MVGDVSMVDGQLKPSRLYSQVPAFSACDRAMIDVLTTTHAGRLAVVELKADEDIHLPLQGLDYWSRVEWHHRSGEFPRFGYFEGHEHCQPRSRCYFSWLRRCTCIPPRIRCYATFHLRLNGSLWGSTNVGRRLETVFAENAQALDIASILR